MRKAVGQATTKLGQKKFLSDEWLDLVADCLPDEGGWQPDDEALELNEGSVYPPLSVNDRLRLRSEIEGAVAYEQELLSRPKEEINALYEDAADQGQFFNAEDASADFGYWMTLDSWSLDEAIALSLGKNPNIVTWPKLKALTQSSKFARQFAARREAARRAVALKPFGDLIPREVFIKWATSRNMEIPSELNAAIEEDRNDNRRLKPNTKEARRSQDLSIDDAFATHTRDAIYKIVLGLAIRHGFDLNYDPTKGSTAFAAMSKYLPPELHVGVKTMRDLVLEARKWAVEKGKVKVPSATTSKSSTR
jgi:hypothetical protein